MELCRRVRQIEEVSPYRDHLDGATAGLDSLGFVPRHDGSGLKAQFGHRLAQGRRLPFPRLGFGQGFTRLDQYPLATTHRNDEVDLSAGLRLVMVDLRVKTPKRREHEVLQEMSGVDQHPRRHRGDQGVIDAVDLFRVGVAVGERRVEEPHTEQEIGVLEPPQVIRHRSIRDLVAQRLEITREAVDGVV